MRLAAWVDQAFPWAIIAAGALLFLWQLSIWVNVSRSERAPSSEKQFFYRRFRRRAQMSFLMVLLRIILIVGRSAFDDTGHPMAAIIFWLVAALLAIWLVVLAAGDLIVGVMHFGRLQHQSELEQLRLSILADRLKWLQGNGQEKPRRSGQSSAEKTDDGQP